MKYILIYGQLMLLALFGKAQPVGFITIGDCYSLARQNYPLIKQLSLIDKSTAYTVNNASKGFLPQVNINGQASYQSAVTELPIKVPGINTPEISKDQYKLYADVNQLIYDAGVTKLQQESQKANGEVEKQKIEISLYQLKERINQLFFSVLIIDEQLKQQELYKKDIQIGINKTEAAIANGTSLRSAADVLRADLLKADQRSIELAATRKGYTDMLSIFINKQLSENTVLARPEFISAKQEITRPELKLYDLESKSLDVQDKLIKTKNLPRVSLFMQGGIGRPALNFLSNKFEPYYMGGLKISWPITGSYTSKNDKALININRRNIDVQKETFLLNTKISLQQQGAEIEKFQQLLATDKKIIELRNSVKKAALAQLENGVATSNDYLREVNAADQAEQSSILHNIQLLMAQYNQQTTTGN